MTVIRRGHGLEASTKFREIILNTRTRPVLGLSTCWKCPLALSHLRICLDIDTNQRLAWSLHCHFQRAFRDLCYKQTDREIFLRPFQSSNFSWYVPSLNIAKITAKYLWRLHYWRGHTLDSWAHAPPLVTGHWSGVTTRHTGKHAARRNYGM